MSAKKWYSEKILMNLFIYFKKSDMENNTEKNVCKSITYEDYLVNFSWCFTQNLTKNWIFIEKITFLRLKCVINK